MNDAAVVPTLMLRDLTLLVHHHYVRPWQATDQSQGRRQTNQASADHDHVVADHESRLSSVLGVARRLGDRTLDADWRNTSTWY